MNYIIVINTITMIISDQGSCGKFWLLSMPITIDENFIRRLRERECLALTEIDLP